MILFFGVFIFIQVCDVKKGAENDQEIGDKKEKMPQLPTFDHFQDDDDEKGGNGSQNGKDQVDLLHTEPQIGEMVCGVVAAADKWRLPPTDSFEKHGGGIGNR